MNDKLSGVDLVSISLKARDLADSAIIAYWTESYGRDIAFHQQGALGALRELADLCGFDLVERVAVKSPAESLEGGKADHARRVREMNAELPEDQRAVLKLKGMIV